MCCRVNWGRALNRRNFLKASAGAALFSRAGFSQAPTAQPNIVLILADDLGYGDLSCYGSDISTPNLDAMAEGGVKFNHFYSASPVCSPARAALLTGRYPTRVGVPGVLGPRAHDGLSLTETTLPQVLKTANYTSMCIGKWHLGTDPGYMPLDRGFDKFYGLPYSNDMSPLPLLDGASMVEPQAQLNSLTSRYTSRAVQFIDSNAAAQKPFFLYMAHTFPHIPLAASDQFRGKSGKGLYGDCIQELDWSAGQVVNALKTNGISDNTLVIFTSDNGPWYQGSPGRLRGRKAETFEGGMREPFLAQWPGRIKAGRTVGTSMATMMDLFPTFANLAGAGLPAAPLDGVDIMPMLTGDADSVDRDPFFYFDDYNLQCVRQGRWKLHVARYNVPPWIPQPAEGRINLPLANPELYDVVSDPQESYDLAAEHPEIVWPLRAKIDSAIRTFPREVQWSWADTLSRLVNGSPAGAWPVCGPNG